MNDGGYSVFVCEGAGLNDDASTNLNVGVGYHALRANTTGSNNTANGYVALYYNTTGSSNTANGAAALYSNTTGSNNTANGFGALYQNTTGYNNIAVGFHALRANTTGSFNTANGYMALYSNTTSDNTANGYMALYSNTTGTGNAALGYAALYQNTTGNYNIAVGVNAGRFIDGGANNTITSNSVFLGTNTKALADSQTNQIVIGDSAVGLGSNTAILGNSSITKTRLQGGIEINASDTTITRVSAGKIAVEGVNVVTTSSTDTLTNKTLRRTVISTAISITLGASDAGKVFLLTTSGIDVTIPADEFIAGDEFTIINDSQGSTMGACTITVDTGVKMFIVATQYLQGGTAGASFSLASRRGVKFICTTGGATPRFYGWRS